MLPASRGVIAAALLILLTGCAPTRHYEAVLVLQDFAASDVASRLKQTTAMPLRQSVTYTVAGRPHTADLYLPGTLDGCVAPASAESRDAAARCLCEGHGAARLELGGGTDHDYKRGIRKAWTSTAMNPSHFTWRTPCET